MPELPESATRSSMLAQRPGATAFTGALPPWPAVRDRARVDGHGIRLQIPPIAKRWTVRLALAGEPVREESGALANFDEISVNPPDLPNPPVKAHGHHR
jgi:hypothetical protein